MNKAIDYNSNSHQTSTTTTNTRLRHDDDHDDNNKKKSFTLLSSPDNDGTLLTNKVRMMNIQTDHTVHSSSEDDEAMMIVKPTSTTTTITSKKSKKLTNGKETKKKSNSSSNSKKKSNIKASTHTTQEAFAAMVDFPMEGSSTMNMSQISASDLNALLQPIGVPGREHTNSLSLPKQYHPEKAVTNNNKKNKKKQKQQQQKDKENKDVSSTVESSSSATTTSVPNSAVHDESIQSSSPAIIIDNNNNEVLPKTRSSSSSSKTKKQNKKTTEATIDISTETEEKSKTKKNQKSVSFGKVEVRSYPIILGDNPDCQSGPPITIGWKYFMRARSSLNTYEKKKLKYKIESQQSQQQQAQQAQSSKDDNDDGPLILDAKTRYIILKDAGYTDNQIKQAIRLVHYAQDDRMKAIHCKDLQWEYKKDKILYKTLKVISFGKKGKKKKPIKMEFTKNYGRV